MSGFGSYFLSNHGIVLVFGILLYFWVSDIKMGPRERRLLILTGATLALVIFPVSAAALRSYQTGFYAYPWIWSLAPVTPCIAWGATAALWKLTAQKRRDGKAGLRLTAGVVVLAALLLLLGNMGNILGVTEEEKTRQRECGQVVACLEEIPEAEDCGCCMAGICGSRRRQPMPTIHVPRSSSGCLTGWRLWREAREPRHPRDWPTF